MSALLLRDLTVERGGREVVKQVSVEIPAAQVTALLGPNGAGKSTLVLAVGGVLKPKAGSVLLDDTDPASPASPADPTGPPDPGATASTDPANTGIAGTGATASAEAANPAESIGSATPASPAGATDLTGRRPERIRQAGVAIVPEGRRLLPDLTVEDNLRVASYSLSRDAAQAGRDRVLELFPQLSKRLSALARTLSGGEQQMVVLAQALISQPRYMLIDELSLGLAPVVVSRLIPVIRTVAESGTGVLLIEQFATVALGLANHAHIMEGGQIRFSGPASDLRDNPDLLRSAYLLRGSQDKPGPETSQPGAVTPLTGRNPLFYPERTVVLAAAERSSAPGGSGGSSPRASTVPNGQWCHPPAPFSRPGPSSADCRSSPCRYPGTPAAQGTNKVIATVLVPGPGKGRPVCLTPRQARRARAGASRTRRRNG